MFDYKIIKVNYDNWKEFDINNINYNKFILEINKEDVKFEFLMKINKLSDKVLVLGSGAFESNKLSPPIFQRHEWTNDFEYNLIYYNDPTLYLGTFNLGWGYGDKNRHYLSEIGDIIKIYLDKLNIKNEDVYFNGSSGGGFQSIMLATLLKGSTAIVNNPQTSIIRYIEVINRRLFRAIYGEDYSKYIEENMWRISLVEFMKKYNNMPKIFYIQNTSWKDDVYNHLIPFIKEIQELEYENNIKIILYYNKEQGHNPIGKNKTISIIKDIIEKNQIMI